jgi:hypothetical protein
MQRYPLVTYQRPCCFWGEDLRSENGRFLDTLAPAYYQFVAASNEERLAGEDKIKAAVAIRTAYGQAVETLLAFLAAAVQAPDFPLGWLIRYRVVELRKVVEAISSEMPVLTRLRLDPVTWEGLSAAIHRYVPETARSEVVTGFAALWKRLAAQFMRDDFAAEYNSIKHSLRIMPGGFSLSFGREKTPGQAAAPEDMRSLGGSEFGSSFYVARAIGEHKNQLALAHHSRNWSMEALLVDLHLVVDSLENVISFLRIISGREGSTFRFSWPSEPDTFEAYRRSLLTVENLMFGSSVRAADITALTDEEILAVYRRATDGECAQ